MEQRVASEELNVSNEAKQRLDSARARDIAFVVKRRLGKPGPNEDVIMIVEMIRDAEVRGHDLTPRYVVGYLISRGRSHLRAEMLTSLLFK
jgi:hypothetical protein